jgi:hypothetical protein
MLSVFDNGNNMVAVAVNDGTDGFSGINKITITLTITDS